ncbi:hypothetical protein Acr_06g0000160 [Actinidia rufa]|uniref:Uncharacterized protein n=1 Tax=Actinidia rufa TaxID=165716 RepID=A0A7J0EPF6_9ERIC|nr:hypothetical protein Acr_06g0000160 [Actinidia rufa]
MAVGLPAAITAMGLEEGAKTKCDCSSTFAIATEIGTTGVTSLVGTSIKTTPRTNHRISETISTTRATRHSVTRQGWKSINGCFNTLHGHTKAHKGKGVIQGLDCAKLHGYWTTQTIVVLAAQGGLRGLLGTGLVRTGRCRAVRHSIGGCGCTMQGLGALCRGWINGCWAAAVLGCTWALAWTAGLVTKVMAAKGQGLMARF